MILKIAHAIGDIININDLDLNSILIDKKPCENILNYDITYKTPYDAKPLRIIFDKNR